MFVFSELNCPLRHQKCKYVSHRTRWNYVRMPRTTSTHRILRQREEVCYGGSPSSSVTPFPPFHLSCFLDFGGGGGRDRWMSRHWGMGREYWGLAAFSHCKLRRYEWSFDVGRRAWVLTQMSPCWLRICGRSSGVARGKRTRRPITAA
jgi:hypothetical protein